MSDSLANVNRFFQRQRRWIQDPYFWLFTTGNINFSDFVHILEMIRCRLKGNRLYLVLRQIDAVEFAITHTRYEQPPSTSR
jgi:hypothetical protein